MIVFLWPRATLKRSDPELVQLVQRALSLDEAQTVPVCLFFKKNDGVIMRQWGMWLRGCKWLTFMLQ